MVKTWYLPLESLRGWYRLFLNILYIVFQGFGAFLPTSYILIRTTAHQLAVFVLNVHFTTD